jgi:tRNA (guanosine-2'-O-)-methyltransferase
VGLELAEGAQPIPDVTIAAEVALVVGHEDRGLSRVALARCDELVYIPQLGKIASLNVATATAIALYEVRRRAWSSERTP